MTELASGGPEPGGDPVGPFQAYGTDFWVKKDHHGVGYVGFDTHNDGEPDEWKTWDQVRDDPNIDQRVKDAIEAQLDSFGIPTPDEGPGVTPTR